MSKLSIYDMLSMIIPGYLVGFLISKSVNFQVILPSEEVTFWIVTFCISFILGISIHYFSRWIFKFLRNNDNLNSTARRMFEKDIRLREGNDRIAIDLMIPKRYYEIYYGKLQSPAVSFIAAMEAQLSFLRSMVIVGAIYMLFGWITIYDCRIISTVALLSLIALGLIFWLRYRIYYFYYEADYYIRLNHHD